MRVVVLATTCGSASGSLSAGGVGNLAVVVLWPTSPCRCCLKSERGSVRAVEILMNAAE
jgi:hypothetical protein